MKSKIKISPSILSADFSKLSEELKAVEQASADYIHIDVMDGNFVPNITFGPKLVKDIRKCTNLTFDTHLMINNPEKYIERFAEAGSDIISVHYETTKKTLDKIIEQVKFFNKKVGVTLSPQTDEKVLKKIINKLDLILVMTVNPGFGGQKFITEQLKKITNIRKMIKTSGKDIDLEVDGGINEETAKLAIKAGANVLVSGSYIFGGDYKERIKSLRN